MTANQITFTRIPLQIILLLIAKNYPLFSLAIFLISILLDKLDGFWARQKDQVTPLGKRLDSAVDRIVIMTAFVAFIKLVPGFPTWTFIAILFRDLLVIELRHLATRQNIKIKENIFGKVKRTLEILAITLCFFLLSPSFLNYQNLLQVGLQASLSISVFAGFWGFFLYLAQCWQKIATTGKAKNSVKLF
jgi:CDP-diacylglycerol--glycerol-3-phosphate 3-phosphatidyltransferase